MTWIVVPGKDRAVWVPYLLLMVEMSVPSVSFTTSALLSALHEGGSGSGVGDGVGLGSGVGKGVGLGSGVGEGVALGWGLGVGEGVALGSGVGLGCEVAVGVGFLPLPLPPGAA